MAFFFPDLHTQINWTQHPRFRDKELAGISLGGTPDSVVADKLVEVLLLDGHARWVLIHIEVQAQRDACMARRVLDYNYRIFKEYTRPVASVVVLADEDPKWRPTALHSRTLGTMLEFSFVTTKLLDYADQAEELLASDNPFAWITLVHLRTQQAGHDADQLYAAKWQLTKLLYRHGWCKERIIVLFRVIDWMMALPEQHQERYWRAVLKQEKEQKMEWISKMEQSFLDKGLAQGRKEGALALLERQLTRRFGPLSQTIRKRMAKASVAQLEVWSDALPEAQSLKQVFEQAQLARQQAGQVIS